MARIKNFFRKYYYKVFGRVLFHFEAQKRRKMNANRSQYKLIKSFRKLEIALKGIKYPNNKFNKIMSMILSDIELFVHIVDRFHSHRHKLKVITRSEDFFRFLNPKAKSYPVHPNEKYVNNAIKVASQSLFVFGLILVNRSLLLLKMYLPDREKNPKYPMYGRIGNLYFALIKKENLSPVSIKFKKCFITRIKWLYSVLRFYRNEFIEHLDKGYQQGINYGVYTEDFALSSYKWDYDINDDKKVENFRSKLEKNGVKITGRSDGGRSLINRYYIQRLFDNIVRVPNELLKEALNLIEDIGVNSPQPTKVISEIEEYIDDLFKFMTQELENSELAQYKKE